MKEVTPERFIEVGGVHAEEFHILALQGWEVGMLHGMIALVAEHPGIEKRESAMLAANHIRSWCLNEMKKWGFSQEEMDFLDRARGAPEDGRDES